MLIFKKIGCRLFQAAFRAVLPLLPYREPRLLSSAEELAAVFAALGPRSVLIVTTAGSARRGLLAPILAVLEREGIGYVVYDKTPPDPTTHTVEEALALFREAGCDTLIAVGGGSAIDCAKGVGARVAYPKRKLDRMAGVMRVLRRLPPLIAVPTTAGTGSEVTLAAVITDAETHRKYAIMSFPLIPQYALLDASFTYTMPPSLTATTGMDALTHAVEAYIGRSTTKKTRALSLEATALIFRHLEAAVADGESREAREGMLTAAYRAGVAFSMSYVGYVHAIGHTLGGLYGVAHGLAMAVLLPHVMREFGASAHKRLAELADVCGIGGANEAEKANAFIRWIEETNAKMGLPDKFDVVQDKDIDQMITWAKKEANPLYPVPVVWARKDFRRLIESIRK